MSNDVEPGWYDDGSGTVRWWDGSQWTQNTSEGGGAPDEAPTQVGGAPAGGDNPYGQTAALPQQGGDAGAYGENPYGSSDAGAYGAGAAGGYGAGGAYPPGGGGGGWDQGSPAGPGGSGGGKGKLYALIGGVAALVIAIAAVVVFLFVRGDDDGDNDTADGDESSETSSSDDESDSDEPSETRSSEDEPDETRSSESEETDEGGSSGGGSGAYAAPTLSEDQVDITNGETQEVTLDVENDGTVYVYAINFYQDLDIVLTITDSSGEELCYADEELDYGDEECEFDAEGGESYTVEVRDFFGNSSTDTSGYVSLSTY